MTGTDMEKSLEDLSLEEIDNDTAAMKMSSAHKPHTFKVKTGSIIM